MFAAWFSVFLSFFFVFFVFFFFSKFSDAFRQTSTLYSVMIDICLFGREISDLVRVFGTSLRFYPTFVSRAGIIIRPVVVVEGDARRIFVATTTFRSLHAVQKIRQSLVLLRCSVSGRRTRRSDLGSRVLVGDQSDRTYELGKCSSTVASFPRCASDWQRTRRDF